MEPPGLITPSNGFSSPPVHQHTLTATSSMQCSELISSGAAPVPPAASLYVPPCHKERKGSQSSSCSSGSLVAVNGYGSNGIASSREAKINGDWRARDEPKSGERLSAPTGLQSELIIHSFITPCPPEKLRSDSGSGSCTSDLLTTSTGAGCGGAGAASLCAASPPSPSPSPSSSSSSAGSSNAGSRGSAGANGASKRVSTGVSAGRAGTAINGSNAGKTQRTNGSSGELSA